VSWTWLITKIHLYAFWKEHSDRFWNWLVKKLHHYAVKQDLHLKSKPGQDCDFAAQPVQDFSKANYKTLTDIEKDDEDKKKVAGEGEHTAKKEPGSSTERAAANGDVERVAGLEEQSFRTSTRV
jgi:hypothetical protein